MLHMANYSCVYRCILKLHGLFALSTVIWMGNLNIGAHTSLKQNWFMGTLDSSFLWISSPLKSWSNGVYLFARFALFVFEVLEIEDWTRASCMLGKCSTIELQPQLDVYFYLSVVLGIDSKSNALSLFYISSSWRLFFNFYVGVVLGIKPRALRMVVKHSATEPQLSTMF